jgi:hypothetical protein
VGVTGNAIICSGIGREWTLGPQSHKDDRWCSE